MSLITGLLHNIIDIYSISTNSYSDVTRTKKYTDVKCRFEKKINKVLSATGEEIISSVQLWILPEYIVSESDEIEKDGKYYKILTIDEQSDLSGNIDHKKIYLA